VPLGELILGLPGGESTSSSTDELLECEREREWERERERDRERECREWCDSASSMSICEEQGLRDLDLERDRDWRRSFSLALMKVGLERWGRCGCCCCCCCWCCWCICWFLLSIEIELLLSSREVGGFRPTAAAAIAVSCSVLTSLLMLNASEASGK